MVESISVFLGGKDMSEDRAITVISERPPLAPRALAGGIVGADLGLFIFVAVSSSAENAVLALLFTMVPAIGLAGIAALTAYILQQRRGSLSRLNQDLSHLNSLMERRLINDEDYHMLKRRVIDDYQPQRMSVHSILTPALWTALVASLIPLTIAGSLAWAPVQAFLTAMLLPGAVGAASGAVGTSIIHRLQSYRRHAELPSGKPVEWQALGTRQSVPLLKK
jgi:hypothetical protein